MLDLAPILADTLDPSTKGYPSLAPPLPVAYLRFSADADIKPQGGELVGCGSSHPCTTFDKWRSLFTVDDDYRVTGAIRTYF
jgi:hypothetical protein